MGIKRFFDKEIVVSRLRVLSGNRRQYSSTATVECHIQDMSPEARVALQINQERAWVGYFSSDDDYVPQVGDRISDENGQVYKVTNVTKKDYSFGINQHIEAVLIEYNE